MTPYDRVVRALKAKDSIRKGDNWQCPAHDDRTPSLSVNRATDRETGEPIVLMYCHAGCSTSEAILPALGIEPSELFSSSLRAGVQRELFPASKFSPIGLEILLRLPPGAERSFIAASALGRFVSHTGGRERVFGQRAIAAVVIETTHRKAIRRELGISASGLSNDIMRWRQWGVAHACSRSVLTILVREGTACPVCKASLVGELHPSEPSSGGDEEASSTSSVGDGSEPESVITDFRFYKELEAKRSDPEESNTGTALKRKRRFEPYPEVAAMEARYRRQREAGAE